MLNILKENLRQAVHDKLLLGAGALLVIEGISTVAGDETLTAATGSEAVGGIGIFAGALLPIFIGVITGRICGTDLRDKTANYEILFGKKRSAVYLGRFFAALIVSCAVTLLVTLVPVCFMALRNGWGGSITAGNALLHLGMIFPFVFRLAAVYAALTFLAGNDLVPITVSFVGTLLVMIASFLLEDAGYALTWQTAASDLKTMLDFSNTTEGFLNGQDILVYKAFLSGGTVLRMLCTSFGIGLMWLAAGLAVYRKRDIS